MKNEVYNLLQRLAANESGRNMHFGVLQQAQMKQYASMDFLVFTPQVTGFNILIPEDKMVEEK